MQAWATFRLVLPHHTTARTHLECRLSPVSNNSGVLPTPMHALMAPRHCHRRFAIAVSVLTIPLAGRLSSTQTRAACRACQIQWPLRPRRVMLGLSLRNLSLMRGGHQAVVSPAQAIHMFRRARTALPRQSTAASTPRTHNFPRGRSD